MLTLPCSFFANVLNLSDLRIEFVIIGLLGALQYLLASLLIRAVWF